MGCQDISDEEPLGRLAAIPEVLPHLAQTNLKSSFVQWAIAAIRKWLCENIPGKKNMKLTDGEIIENYLIPAREFVQQGRTAAAPGGLAGTFSIQKRARLVPQAEDAALAEERYSGKVRARTDEFEASLRDPLIKAIHESGGVYDDVEEYLHALHAPSRNAAMRDQPD